MISIVVVNYGYNDFVAECLSSLDATAGRDRAEVILVDNGSLREDRCRLEEIFRRRGSQIDHYVVLSENRGLGNALNAGIKMAQGDLIVALNSDTLIGERLLLQFEEALKTVGPRTGFLAVSIYDWQFGGGRSEKTATWQADVLALTCYASGIAIRCGAVRPEYVLGPAGPAFAMTRKMVEDLKQHYGDVCDPHFYLYGEDVDLFLRARMLGYETCFVEGLPESGGVVWHIGSATTAGGMVNTETKPPMIMRMVLDGFRDNARLHSGWLELPVTLSIQVAFRAFVYVRYWQRNSLGRLLQLVLARQARRPKPMPRRGRPPGFWLLRQTGLLYRSPLPWSKPRTPKTGCSLAAKASTE